MPARFSRGRFSIRRPDDRFFRAGELKLALSLVRSTAVFACRDDDLRNSGNEVELTVSAKMPSNEEAGSASKLDFAQPLSAHRPEHLPDLPLEERAPRRACLAR